MISLPWDPEALRQFCELHSADQTADLILKYAGKTDLPYGDFIEQFEAHKRIRDKVPEWSQRYDLYLPPARNLAQASSTETARHKAHYVSGRVADLCGGSGVDAWQLGLAADELSISEPDKDLVERTEYNLNQLNIRAGFFTLSAEAFLEQYAGGTFDWIYLDPSRRDEDNRRTVALHRMEPDITGLWDTLLERSHRVMVKLSPLFDLTEIIRKLDGVYQIDVVARKGEVKEILVLAGRADVKSVEVRAVELYGNRAWSFHGIHSSPRLRRGLERNGETGKYLYDPHPALAKAGLSHEWAAQHNLLQVNAAGTLFTADELYEDYPGRVLVVMQTGKPYKLKGLPGQMSIVTRGYYERPEQVKKRLKCGESESHFLYAYTVSGKNAFFTYAIRMR